MPNINPILLNQFVSGLSRNERHVILSLLWMARRDLLVAPPSIDELAEESGASEEDVKRAVKLLPVVNKHGARFVSFQNIRAARVVASESIDEREEEAVVCEILRRSILRTYPRYRNYSDEKAFEPTRRAWIKVLRALHEKNKRSYDRQRFVANWLLRGDGDAEFWRKNILSAQKFREHFDRIEPLAKKSSRAFTDNRIEYPQPRTY